MERQAMTRGRGEGKDKGLHTNAEYLCVWTRRYDVSVNGDLEARGDMSKFASTFYMVDTFSK